MRVAALTPIIDQNLTLVGALAVDVGWVDDLQRINRAVSDRVWATTLGLLAVMALACILVMFIVFRPMRRLIRLAQDLGNGEIPESVPSRARRGSSNCSPTRSLRVGDLQGDLSDRALHDQLTGLPNRTHFRSVLQNRLDLTQVGERDFALLLIDLDQFKEVNDGLGHAAGDELLVVLADMLRRALAPDEFLARLGGDEFALLSGPIASESDAERIALRVSDAISAATTTSVAEIGVTTSIGITMLPRQADTADLALSHADLALYRAKRGGRAHWQFYRSTLNTPVQRRIHLATELRRALKQNELRLVYQPMVDPITSSIAGLEALARWDHPTEGPIPPSEFITVAESAGLINELGSSHAREGMQPDDLWRQRGLVVPRVSVNVSTIQLWQPDFVQQIREVLAANQLAPSDLCLEITESVVVHHADRRSHQILHDLVALGVRLSIDDFGTGYSSLSYLQDLEVHQIKIDRLFLANATPGSSGEQLFAGIASLGRSLGLEVVAEGVETTAELRVAQRYGCNLVQGYLLARELSPDDAAGLMAVVSTALAIERIDVATSGSGTDGRRIADRSLGCLITHADVVQRLEPQPSKLMMRVRFPSSAPRETSRSGVISWPGLV